MANGGEEEEEQGEDGENREGKGRRQVNDDGRRKEAFWARQPSNEEPISTSKGQKPISKSSSFLPPWEPSISLLPDAANIGDRKEKNDIHHLGSNPTTTSPTPTPVGVLSSPTASAVQKVIKKDNLDRSTNTNTNTIGSLSWGDGIHEESDLVNQVDLPGVYIPGSKKWERGKSIVNEIDRKIALICGQTTTTSFAKQEGGLEEANGGAKRDESHWNALVKSFRENPFCFLPADFDRAFFGGEIGLARLHAQLVSLCYRTPWFRKKKHLQKFQKIMRLQLGLHLDKVWILNGHLIWQCATTNNRAEETDMKKKMKLGAQYMRIGAEDVVRMDIDHFRQSIHGLAPLPPTRHLREVLLSTAIESEDEYDLSDPVHCRAFLTFQLAVDLVFCPAYTLDRSRSEEECMALTRLEKNNPAHWVERLKEEPWIPVYFYYHNFAKNDTFLKSLDATEK